MMILSPITHSEEVVHIKDLDTNKIIDLYRRDFGIDVIPELTNFPQIGIFQCKSSLLRFYAHYETIAGKDAFYCQLAQKYASYYSEDKWEFNAVLPFFKKTSKVLEIGSGHGYFLDKLKKLQIKDLTGLEISSEAAKTCQQKGHQVINSPIEDLDEDKTYDVICSFQIFEHLPNVDATLLKSIKLLKKDGLLMISVPNNFSLLFSLDPYHTLNLPPHHVMLWDEISLRKIAKLYDLEVVDILKSEATISEKSRIYKLQLAGIFGSFLGTIFHTLTRFWAKNLMGQRYGAAIIAIYRKK